MDVSQEVSKTTDLKNHCAKMADLIAQTVVQKSEYLAKLHKDAQNAIAAGDKMALTAIAQMLEVNIAELQRIEQDLRAGVAAA